MDLSLVALGASILAVVSVEWILWHFFARHIRTLQFPQSSDQSDLRFFTIGRLRVCAILHTLLLLFVSYVSFITLW